MTKEDFLKDVTDWSNHRPLLWLALEATKTGDVMEYGTGGGSTPQLHEYCKDANRRLYSFDTELKWMNEWSHLASESHTFHHIINHWEVAQEICRNPKVILIDNAPGERRIVDIKNWSDNMNGIIVIHDSQPQPTAADYKYETIWSLFKYRIDLTVTPNMAVSPWQHKTWASAVSNDYDVTQWAGMETGNPDYKLTVYPR